MTTAHELLTKLVWQECPANLKELGLSEKAARSNIGRWLKNGQPEKVLRAVEAAMRVGTLDPIPYINEVLAEKVVEQEDGRWMVKPDTPQWRAWESHARRFNDERQLAQFRYATQPGGAGQVEVRSQWPRVQ